VVLLSGVMVGEGLQGLSVRSFRWVGGPEKRGLLRAGSPAATSSSDVANWDVGQGEGDMDDDEDFFQRSANTVGATAFNAVSNMAELLGATAPQTQQMFLSGSKPVSAALLKITKDMNILDEVAGQTPQLTRLELVVLLGTVFVSGLSPVLLDARVTELLVPSMAAVSAAVGISAEYVGKVAISNGKEVAAVAIQAAAEAESILAAAERTKAVVPLCVGVATTASAFALLIPALVSEINIKHGIKLVEEVYLICPLIAVLAAAVAGLAMQESKQQASRASGIGNRRFASSDEVNRTWMSATEQISISSDRATRKWFTFGGAVLLAPVLGVFTPGSLPFKAIVTAAIASCQAAYYITLAEYAIAEATTAVAIKAKTAAVADTYANQGSRAGAVLPFTSALAGLCAAASAAAIELIPLIHMVEMQSLLAIIFPTGASMFAAAASVSKARCEVDASAASVAVSTLATNELNKGRGPVRTVIDLIRLTVKTRWRRFRQGAKRARSYGQRKWRHTVGIIRGFFGRPPADRAQPTQPTTVVATNGQVYLDSAAGA